MNSTVKSLVFWVAMVLVVLVVWNFSTRFQRSETAVSFSEFLAWVDSGQVARVTITGNELTGITQAKENFRTYAPLQYEGLANRLIDKKVIVNAKEPTASPWATLLLSWAPILLHHRLLDLLHAADAERRQQGPVVRQEQGEALLVARRRR